jgi:threonine/homoserine/homoserine lactone efflux protein
MFLKDVTPAFLDLAFVRGSMIGFALAAPVGPVGILCIRRALARNFLEAFTVGLGAAFADMSFGAVAGLGLTIVSAFVMSNQVIIGLLGGTLVLGLGITTFRVPVVLTDGTVAVNRLRRDVAAAFSMAITNPATMIAAAGVFAAVGPVDIYTAPAAAAWLVAGVFAGSAAWWAILAGGTLTLRRQFVSSGLPWLNRVSGAIIAVSGITVLMATALTLLNASP